jgi:hypothetical protein
MGSFGEKKNKKKKYKKKKKSNFQVSKRFFLKQSCTKINQSYKRKNYPLLGSVSFFAGKHSVHSFVLFQRL